MERIYGLKKDFAPISTEGTRITIGYDQQPVEGHEEAATWTEIYLPKKQLPQLTLAAVKEAIIQAINNRVHDRIVSGFEWDGKPVWLSEENQMNFTTAKTPVRLKIGETEDGTPVYHDFERKTDLTAFTDACIAWRQQQLADGWAEKDAIDWAPYEAYFQQTDETETAE